MGELGATGQQARPGVEREIAGIGHAGMESEHAGLAVMVGLRQHDLATRRDRIAAFVDAFSAATVVVGRSMTSAGVRGRMSR